ncbi:hypothetical protein FB567DRAFT_106379 [Paraphoma chrysanthemicola]|uniref:Uncharacterized protein n=1 Tax=Paraphoma chrysanthemicola TaxID=798071 RepID=A0A8K0VWV3_9PLEO|nr:hypothetical protein FB567DRAFT_106379 [Paraphoma chrysanthemicola]
MRSPRPAAPPDVGPNVLPSFAHERNAPLDDAPNNLQRMPDEQNSRVQSSKAAHFLPAARISPYPALQWDQLAPMSRQEDEGDIDVRSMNRHTPAERYSDVFSSHPAPYQDSFEDIQPSPMQAERQAVGQFGQHISPTHSPHVSPRLLPQQQQQTLPQPSRNDFYSRPRPQMFPYSTSEPFTSLYPPGG